MRRSFDKDYEVCCLFSESTFYLIRILQVCWRFAWMNKKNYDIVVVGFFAQLIFPFVRMFWRGKIISDCFISLYDSLICDRARYRKGGLIARLSFKMDAYMLRHSDVSLTDTLVHARYMSKTFDLDIGRIKEILVSADDEVFTFSPARAEQYVEGTVFRVLFYGAFIPLHGVEVIVEAASYLKEVSMRVEMVGSGQTHEEARQLAKSLGCENIDFIEMPSLVELAEMSRRSHLLLGIFGSTEKARRVIPNKVFEAVALGRPVITGDSQTIRDFFVDGENIILVPFGDARALADKILWAQQNYAAACAIGCSGRKVFDEELSLEHVRKELSYVVDSVLAR